MEAVSESARSRQTRSIPALFRRNAEKFGNEPAYREKEFGIWQCWTWAQVAAQVETLAKGLIDLGLKEGDFVAVVGRNRPDLYMSMVAVQMARAVPVPLYQDAVADEMAWTVDHCEARFVIAGDQEQVDKVLEIQGKAATLETVIYLDPRGLRNYDHSRLHSYRSLLDRGKESGPDIQKELERREAAIDSEDICVILYTSGTTGRSKGVVLTHGNIISAARISAEFDRLERKDDVLAYMPMAWVGDFIFSIGQSSWTGFCVNCPESADTMTTDLREIGPSYFFAPPRVLEHRLTEVMIRMEDAGRIKRGLFEYFMAHARRVGASILDRRPVGLLDRIKYALGEILIYGPLKNTLGYSRIRVGYTAGEAIGPDIFDFYRSLGINLKQLYGQTEASVFITYQPDNEVRSDTVGIAAPEVDLRVDEKGEVFYRCPGVFREYYRDPENTRATKDADGWVATGDAGFFEKKSGHLRIIDRAKDVGKLADGRMFAPKYVENKLKFYPSILEAVVFGLDREHCVAFINIDLAAVGSWAERGNIAYSSYQELAGHPQVLDRIQSHIEEVNAQLAQDEMLGGCQIRRFLVLHKELDADDGELTRTRKVRRQVIGEKYRDLIDALYSDDTSVSTKTEVTYEDGRKGSIAATLNLRDTKVVALESASPSRGSPAIEGSSR
ncbi:MAG: AMP-binding protein [Ectothiorhodospiraceae bacterium AqS1]|nr:AMP-binding protein [Ectothiorhodospiraceae bacterium AqS1]